MTPPVTKNLIIINALFFFALNVGTRWGMDLNDMLGLHFFLAPNFNPIQLVTYMFMHANFMHIAFNMFSLWMFGRIIESVMGSKRFLLFYLLCGIGAGVCQELVQFISYYAQGLDQYQMVRLENTVIPMAQYLGEWTTIGASGAIYGVLVAFGMLFPNEMIMLLIPPIPLKAKYMVIVFIVIDLVCALGNSGDSVAHFAHLGGAFFGWLLIYLYKKKQNRQRSQFTSWEEYNPQKETIRERMKNAFKAKKEESEEEPQKPSEPTSVEDLNEILAKIKRSGYDSLTAEEKEKLFRK